ncbi:DNA-directed RNA polymerase specialized sigma24 family protein [Allonocardiopsis opalescens]|uniref:DNA-directed RNA polymerase specialized sigma24 family protein n=1 Tax=Allonocardiopsis opalescens TaxID=1144618 RepID=A0A2T0PXV0_9ACTN|nr:DNA-directed RNA polymerase specialized sigma24 family protein [Allonocardiopsis opalescens]
MRPHSLTPWPSVDGARDAAAVKELRGGDKSALSRMYDAYAARLHDYAAALLGDYAEAHEVVADTFTIAKIHIHRLAEPARLGPWLYALARAECLHRDADGFTRAPGLPVPSPVRATPPDGVPLPAGLADLMSMATPSASEGAEGAADDLRTAMAAATPAEQEAVRLTEVHELGVAELAAVLGVREQLAEQLVDGGNVAFSEVATALLLARAHPGGCPELRELTDPDAPGEDWLSPEHRKALARHLDQCVRCWQRRAERRLNADIRQAQPPPVAVPDDLRELVSTTAFGTGRVRYRAELGKRTGPTLGPDGFPRPRTARRRLPFALAGGAVAAAVAGTVIAVQLAQGASVAPVSEGASPQDQVEQVSTAPSPSPSPSPSASEPSAAPSVQVPAPSESAPEIPVYVPPVVEEEPDTTPTSEPPPDPDPEPEPEPEVPEDPSGGPTTGPEPSGEPSAGGVAAPRFTAVDRLVTVLPVL